MPGEVMRTPGLGQAAGGGGGVGVGWAGVSVGRGRLVGRGVKVAVGVAVGEGVGVNRTISTGVGVGGGGKLLFCGSMIKSRTAVVPMRAIKANMIIKDRRACVAAVSFSSEKIDWRSSRRACTKKRR